MTPKRLTEIKARCDAATKGPWQYCGHGRGGCQCGSVFGVDGNVGVHHAPSLEMFDGVPQVPGIMADQLFIAAARQDVPDLIAEVERLQAEVTALTQQRDALAAAAKLLNLF